MKALASDFDGTIFFEGGFKENDLKKIKEFQNQGYLFGLCSGRPFKGIEIITNEQITYDFYILCTGALILDKNHQVIYKNTITKELLQEYYQRYFKDYKMFIQANFQIYTFENEDIGGIIRQQISSLDEVEGDIYGISMNAINEENATIVCEDINTYFPNLHAFQNKEYIDVVPKGSSKGDGIKRLKDTLKLESISGIGDSYNDITMLEEVDQAFTFHSSPDIVKSHADHIVSSVEEAIDIILKQ